MIETTLTKFANWLSDERYRQIKHNVWVLNRWNSNYTSSYNDSTLFETTEQIVKKFLKENK